MATIAHDRGRKSAALEPTAPIKAETVVEH